MTALALVVAATLVVIACLHAYWGCGGTWGSLAAIPKTEAGALVFRPGRVACFIVAFAMVGAAAVCLMPVVPLSHGFGRIGRFVMWVLVVLFFVRFIGDFRYVGIFRKIKRTDFAALDAKFYTPLCGAYAVSFLLMALSGMGS